MEKKDLIKVENAAIRAAGSRMAKMFQPMGEHEGDNEARRAFYEGFQEGAAYYRLLISRIDDEFGNPIENARLDSGSEGNTHSAMEMCLKNGIPVITAMQKAPVKEEAEKLRDDFKNVIATVSIEPEVAKKLASDHTTETEAEEPSKDDSAVPETMEDCIKTTPKTKCDAHPIDDTPIWMSPMEALAKMGVEFTQEGDEEHHYLRFEKDGKQFTVYFEKRSDGRYKTVLSDLDDKGGQLLWEGIVTGSVGLVALECKIVELVKGW